MRGEARRKRTCLRHKERESLILSVRPCGRELTCLVCFQAGNEGSATLRDAEVAADWMCACRGKAGDIQIKIANLGVPLSQGILLNFDNSRARTSLSDSFD